MRFTLGKFTAAVVVLVALIGASIASAQCLTCTDPFGGHCITVSSGHGSCTDYPIGDITCKLACPNCPGGPCDTGGGGGGDCVVFTGDMKSFTAYPGYATATVGVLFKSDASTNAHLFGGRGQGYRVVPGSVFGDVDASAVRQTVQNLTGSADLRVAFAFSNFNEAGIPVQFVAGTEGFAFAPSTNGVSANIKFRVQNANKLERALNRADLQSSDLLLIDVKVRGQAYVMAINVQTLNESAGDFSGRVTRIQDLLRQSVNPLRDAEPMVYKIPDC